MNPNPVKQKPKTKSKSTVPAQNIDLSIAVQKNNKQESEVIYESKESLNKPSDSNNYKHEKKRSSFTLSLQSLNFDTQKIKIANLEEEPGFLSLNKHKSQKQANEFKFSKLKTKRQGTDKFDDKNKKNNCFEDIVVITSHDNSNGYSSGVSKSISENPPAIMEVPKRVINNSKSAKRSMRKIDYKPIVVKKLHQ